MMLSRRLLLFLAVLPQLLVLGLGAGAVLCLDRDGDAHIQISARSCCEGTPAGPAESRDAGEGADDCQSCIDFSLVPDAAVTRAPARVQPEAGSTAVPADLFGLDPMPRSRPRAHRVGTGLDREPPTLIGIRSVVLRC